MGERSKGESILVQGLRLSDQVDDEIAAANVVRQVAEERAAERVVARVLDDRAGVCVGVSVQQLLRSRGGKRFSRVA